MTHYTPAYDDGLAFRAKLGLVVLSSDQTVEQEYRHLLRDVDGVGLYATRVAMDNIVTPQTLAAMEPRITAATDLILPGAPLDVVAYGCTSASIVLGEQTVFDRIRDARPDIACTTPITAGFAALNSFGAKRIAVITPYTDEVNAHVQSYIEKTGGFTVTAFASFHDEDDRRVARISEVAITEAATDLGSRDDVDAVFISCTSLRVARIAQPLEEKLGKPVTGSNHAMVWHSLRLAGVEDKLPGCGSLFLNPL